ncbi:uncharacterized protein LOC110118136 [Ceratitis capitata]|uniref:uncharacterized protein LOC110118136 n=1 Tax=Ceratitis capitata TaxID=7213 RepID=UPI000A11C51E|nr:uncharacterized protein LOC110118136 [Ceratitis capitata]
MTLRKCKKKMKKFPNQNSRLRLVQIAIRCQFYHQRTSMDSFTTTTLKVASFVGSHSMKLQIIKGILRHSMKHENLPSQNPSNRLNLTKTGKVWWYSSKATFFKKRTVWIWLKKYYDAKRKMLDKSAISLWDADMEELQSLYTSYKYKTDLFTACKKSLSCSRTFPWNLVTTKKGSIFCCCLTVAGQAL